METRNKIPVDKKLLFWISDSAVIYPFLLNSIGNFLKIDIVLQLIGIDTQKFLNMFEQQGKLFFFSRIL